MFPQLLGRFNVSLAYNMKGVESSRPSSSTVTPTPTSSSSTSTTPTLSVSKAPSPGIIGGIVIGGLVGLGLIAALITFLVLRSKQKSRSQRPDTASFEKSPDMVISPDTATSLHTSLNYVSWFRATRSEVNWLFFFLQNANDQNAYNFADPNIYDPYRPNLSPHVTGNDSAQNHAHNSGRYSGMPEFWTGHDNSFSLACLFSECPSRGGPSILDWLFSRPSSVHKSRKASQMKSTLEIHFACGFGGNWTIGFESLLARFRQPKLCLFMIRLFNLTVVHMFPIWLWHLTRYIDLSFLLVFQSFSLRNSSTLHHCYRQPYVWWNSSRSQLGFFESERWWALTRRCLTKESVRFRLRTAWVFPPHPSPAMLVTAATTLLCLLLPSQVNGLISTDAKCLSGYEWVWPGSHSQSYTSAHYFFFRCSVR